MTVIRGSSGSVLDAPFALTVVRPDSARPGQRHAGAEETLALIPGLSANSRSNPSQDPRVSIRGFGARSAFGVRGVRVLRDGIPLTLPDGQTPLDYLSLESVGHVEVMRGAASALYGNASGGVIDMRSSAPSAAPLSVTLHQWGGSFGMSRTAAVASGTSGSIYYQGDAVRVRTNGAREHARQRATTGFARAGVVAGGTDYTLSVLGLDMPLAENPGALTLTQMRNDVLAADQPSVAKNARKEVRQLQVGLSAARPISGGEISAFGFGGARSLDNPLTFAVVEIGRHSYGASVRVVREAALVGRENRLTAGVDFQSQNDLRRNFANCTDSPPLASPTTSCPRVATERGILTLDQRELVTSAGIYASDELRLGPRVRITAGLRADNVRFEVRDRLIGHANPDDSGDRTMRAVTPIVGIVSRTGARGSVYANVSSAFETPTATELGNQPDGSAGLNTGLKPQRSTTYEVGLKGTIARWMHYDAAIYSTGVRDELVPFEIPLSNGRRYFRNAGRTDRAGAEGGVELLMRELRLHATYTYSRFRFDRYSSGGVDFGGNEIPGIPQHRVQSALTWSGARGFAVMEVEGAGAAFVDDANSATAPGYEVAHLRLGGRLFPRATGLRLTAGVQNLFDRSYAPSIAVNAARGKYFEPAQGRTFYVGFSIRGEWH
ncbi:MAG: TonB-dependent receptor [Gemmatimonadaceae bacterium]|nr:TonB-dependent receptor [Gemmatimonadaceae bacterium]